ncbi:WD-40 repeat-containing protein [Lenzites betulinus]|nr:WD-40 repeat-containing protein [Lenzites betulinus]
MSTAPRAPAPKHIIRSHAAAVSVLHVSRDNARIYSGDAAGTVVVTSARTLRALAEWRAHEDGLLGVQEWEGGSHARDNKLHVWAGVREPGSTHALGGSAALPGLQSAAPALRYSLDVNALNFCRFSLLELEEGGALLAVPNLVESAYADIWTLPGKQRLHAAIGKTGQAGPILDADGREVRNPIGIIMSMHLSSAPHPHTAAAGRARLRLLCGYENGSVTLWGRADAAAEREVSVEGMGWDALWSVRLHVESVMAMAVSPDGAFALSVSADHLVGRYNIADAEAACTVFKTKHPGNGAVAIADDGRVCAVGGWDGRVRLYATRTGKALGTLAYHKQNCQCVAFAHAQPTRVSGDEEDGDEDEDGMTEEERVERARWLVSGGQDRRVAIWPLMDFGKT